METEGLDFASRAGVAGRALRASSSSARPRIRAAAARRERDASGCSRCSSAPRPTTCACCGSRARRRGAREYLLGRGLEEGALRRVPRRLLAVARGTRVLTRRGGRATANEELLAAGLAVRGARGPGLSTASAAGSCSRSPTSAGACCGFGARAMRAGERPKYLNTREGEVFHKGRQLYGADLARAAAAQGGRGRARRGLHRRDRAAPGRRRQRGRRDGHGADRPSRSTQLQRLAPMVLLCQDADAAGQEARGTGRATRAAGPRLELPRRPAAAGRRSGRRRGAGGRRRARCARCSTAAVPFARFEVERIARAADTTTTRRSREVGAVHRAAARRASCATSSSSLASEPARASAPDLVESARCATARPQAVAPDAGGAAAHRRTERARRSTAASRPSAPSSRSASRCRSAGRSQPRGGRPRRPLHRAR